MGYTLAIGSRLNDGINGIDSGHIRIYDLSETLNNKNFEVNSNKIYPNPSSGVVYFKNWKGKELKVITMLGEIVWSYKLNTDLENQELNLSHLNPGLYLIEINTGDNLITKQLILK
jgi:outer membrane protein assembly factor BamB